MLIKASLNPLCDPNRCRLGFTSYSLAAFGAPGLLDNNNANVRAVMGVQPV